MGSAPPSPLDEIRAGRRDRVEPHDPVLIVPGSSLADLADRISESAASEEELSALRGVEQALARGLLRFSGTVAVPDESEVADWLQADETSEEARAIRRTRVSLRRILWPICLLFCLAMGCGVLFLAYVAIRALLVH